MRCHKFSKEDARHDYIYATHLTQFFYPRLHSTQNISNNSLLSPIFVILKDVSKALKCFKKVFMNHKEAGKIR